MRGILPPLCLVLALLCFVGGFTLISVGAPEPDMELHRAWLQGDESHQKVLEDELEHRQWLRRIVTGGAFASGVLLVVTAFVTMRSPSPR